MPLGLLLQSAFGSWQKDIAKLAGWNQLVVLEDVLLARARGAFMGRWFGNAVPMFAGEVRIAIVNLDELKQRFRLMRREALRNTADINLTEPIAGIAGTMVGALLAPTSSMVLMASISEQMPGLVTTLIAATNWLTFGAVGVLAFGVGVPLLAAGLPFGVIAMRDDLAVAHRFLGGLARLFIAVRNFLEQLLGPRSGVKNPLVARVLEVLDHLATLVPFLFALVAFVVIWVGPKLQPLADFLDRLVPLATDVFAVIVLVFTDLFAKLEALYAGPQSPWAIVQGIIRIMTNWFTLVIDQFTALYNVAKPAFQDVPVVKDGEATTENRVWHEVKRLLTEAFDKVLPFILKMTRDNWLIKRLKEIFSRLGTFADIFKRGTKVKKKPETGAWAWVKGKAKTSAIEALEEAAPAWPSTLKFPDTPTIGDFPDAKEIFNREEWEASLRWTQPDVLAAFTKPDGGITFVFSEDATKALEKLRKPPFDVFAAERKALLKGEKPADILKKAQEEEKRLVAAAGGGRGGAEAPGPAVGAGHGALREEGRVPGPQPAGRRTSEPAGEEGTRPRARAARLRRAGVDARPEDRARKAGLSYGAGRARARGLRPCRSTSRRSSLRSAPPTSCSGARSASRCGRSRRGRRSGCGRPRSASAPRAGSRCSRSRAARCRCGSTRRSTTRSVMRASLRRKDSGRMSPRRSRRSGATCSSPTR
jgi:hypothetical protein